MRCMSRCLHLSAVYMQRPQVSLLPWKALSDGKKCLFGGHLATTEHQHLTEVTQFEETAPGSGLLSCPHWHRLQNPSPSHV